MRKRRKVTWFPALGEQWEDEDDATIHSAGFSFSITTLDTESRPVTGVFPITFDSPQSEGAATAADTPLVDIVGSEYLLKRLVGKLHLTNDSFIQAGQSTGTVKLVEAGFFVGRADNPPDQASPIGFTDATYVERYDNYSPGAARTLREPWIWRRTWLLGLGEAFQTYQRLNIAAGQPINADARSLPNNNVEAPSALDGPHFDAKSARRVGNDDRLFFAITVTPWPYASPPDQTDTLEGHLDVRILGLLVKAHNRSTF